MLRGKSGSMSACSVSNSLNLSDEVDGEDELPRESENMYFWLIVQSLVRKYHEGDHHLVIGAERACNPPTAVYAQAYGDPT